MDWFRAEDGWLRMTQIRTTNDLLGLAVLFREAFDGLVVDDGNVPATASVASTAAGVERLLPVRFDAATHSLCTRLTQQLRLPVKLCRQATSNDFFIAGDSGAGCLNPRALTLRPDSGLPSGLRAWEDHCRRYFTRWDMSITGFMLDGASGASTENEFAAYGRFSRDGAGTHFEQGPALHGEMATCPDRDLPESVEAAARVIADRAKAAHGQALFFGRAACSKRLAGMPSCPASSASAIRKPRSKSWIPTRSLA